MKLQFEPYTAYILEKSLEEENIFTIKDFVLGILYENKLGCIVFHVCTGSYTGTDAFFIKKNEQAIFSFSSHKNIAFGNLKPLEENIRENNNVVDFKSIQNLALANIGQKYLKKENLFILQGETIDSDTKTLSLEKYKKKK